MRKQRQLFAKPRMSGQQRKSLIRAALLDFPLRQAARERKRSERRTPKPKPKRRAAVQLSLLFYRRRGWLEVLS